MTPSNWDTGFGSAKLLPDHCRKCGRTTAYGMRECVECALQAEAAMSADDGTLLEVVHEDDSRAYFDRYIAGDR